MITTHLSKIKDILAQKDGRELKRVCEYLQTNIEHYDWVGFYSLQNNELILGDYAGKPTEHTKIAMGKGVCGQVAESKKTMIVQDVNAIDNYISCSIDVQSEIVVPIVRDGKFLAELDIDSHSPAPFTDFDTELLESICNIIDPSLL